MKHKITKCKLIRITKVGIAEWKCPKCNFTFECGTNETKKMFCGGTNKITIRKWYVYPSFEEVPFIIDLSNEDVDDDEISLCIREQLFGDKT